MASLHTTTDKEYTQQVSEASKNPNSWLGDVTANADFFALYGLPKYTASTQETPVAPSSGSISTSAIRDYENKISGLTKTSKASDTFLGYIPIEISTTKFSTSVNSSTGFADNVDEEDDSGLKVKIILPWKPQELRDSVSVSFSKKNKTGNNIENIAKQHVAGLLSDITGSDIASQFLTTEYHAESLKKEIGLDFILPLTGNIKNANIEWVNEVRKKLGTLQGLVYPKGLLSLYPPILKVKVGNIYSGFKGYITSVELSFSEDMITLEDGSVFPLVINGTIRFINLFTYGWYADNNGSSLTDEFNLSKNPALLFGVQIADVHANAAMIRTSPTINKSSTTAEAKSKIATGVKSLNISSVVNSVNNSSPAELNYDSFKNSIAVSNRNTDILTGFSNEDTILTNQITQYINNDYATDDMIFSDTSNLYNEYYKNYSAISNGNLDFLGVNSNSELISSSNNIMSKVLNVNTISNYAKLIKNIKNGDVIDILASLSQVTSGTSGVLNSNIRNILNSTKVGISILRTLDISGINLDNIAAIYGSVEELLKYINKIDVKKPTAKDEFATAVYASTLQSQQIGSILNNVNTNINNANVRYDNQNNNLSSSVLTSLSNSSNSAISTEIYSNYDMYKQVIDSLRYKTTELADSKIINTNVLNSTAKMSDYIKKVDTSSVFGVSDIYKSSLNKIDESM
jgi:molybdopterin converting factor small subunit